jgi:hypothetical protein
MQQQHHIQFSQQGNNNNNSSASYQQQHRNSLNNLMPFSSLQQQQHQQFANRRNSSCGTDRMTMNAGLQKPIGFNSGSNELILNDANKGLSMHTLITSISPVPSTNTMDINSRLESLCRQMTEQAIN